MRALPGRIRAERAAGWRSRFHFRFPDDAHPEWTVLVDGAACDVAEGLSGAADCTVTAKADTFVGIATGRQSPQTAFLMGRVKVTDIARMLRFLEIFPPLRAG
jgi:putative sterol carrier protein